MTTPEINELIQPLEQYVTPDQKAELEKILSIGKKWKAEGEQKKQEFRENNDRDKFVQQLLNYPEKKNKREEENKKTLEEVGYEKMNLIEKKKFEKEFISDVILHSYYSEMPPKEKEKITLDEFKENGLKIGSTLDSGFLIGDYGMKLIVEALTKTGGFKNGVTLDFNNTRIGDKWAIALAQSLEKTGGLREGSQLDLSWNKIGINGINALAAMLEKTGGLREGCILNLGGNIIGDDLAITISKMLEKTGGLREGCVLNLGSNQIGYDGTLAIAQVLKKTGGIKNGSTLDLGRNQIGIEGAKVIVEAIEQTGGLREGCVLNLGSNNSTYHFHSILQKLKDDAQDKGIKCEVIF